MQYQVPQFIETEDKIVGPFSIRQFIYVAVGVGISGMLYFVLQTWLWAIFAAILIGGSLAISFIKVQGRPLIRVISSGLRFYWTPQTYVWQPEHPVLPHRAMPEREPEGSPVLQKIAEGMALHKSWQNLQTGEKMSATQLTDERMYGRYQIFQKASGERQAARRVDYR